MSLKSTIKSISVVAAGSLILGFTTMAAHATVIFTLTRVSDTVGHLTGTGTADFGGRYFVLEGATTTGDLGAEPVGGDFTIGGDPLQTSFVLNLTNDFFFRADFAGFLAGAAVAGTAVFTLDAETWAAAGTTGTVAVYSSDSTAVRVGDTGRYTIIAVPEPGVLALFGLGLAGLGAVRRKRS